MALVPCGHRLLVKPFKIEEIDPRYKAAKAAGIHIPELDEKEREKAAVVRGTVVSIGPTAWKDFNSDPWCVVGDRIFYAKYSGSFIKDPEDKEDYVLLNDEDVIAVITGDE